MSRVSQKSNLSPSIAKGSGSIDLGKNSGVDMGQKTQPSITSGGIGITQEITSIGGISVTGGVSAEISPVKLGISTDPSEGSISVAGGAELPGGILGISGGVTVDINTGEIIGGSIGGEVGGLGINVSNSKEGGLGIEFTVQIPGTPIELSLGFGFPPKGKDATPNPYITPAFGADVESLTEPKTPVLPPYTDPANPPPWPPAPPKPPAPPISGKDEICKMIVTFRSGQEHRYWSFNGVRQAGSGRSYRGLSEGNYDDNGFFTGYVTVWADTYYWENLTPIDSRTSLRPPLSRPPSANYPPWNNKVYPYDTKIRPFVRRQLAGYEVWEYWGSQYSIYAYLEEISYIGNPVQKEYESSQAVWWFWFSASAAYNIYSIEAHWCSKKPELDLPPPPNPPPRKRNKMDACCQENLKLLRAIYLGLGIYKFPGKLPATIIQEVSKEGEEPPEPPQVPIANFVDLLTWQFERDDERWGQWQVQIDIKDSDITKEGDQKKTIKLPNLAESIAEFEGQLLSIMTNVEALVALQVKTLAESGMARQEAIKGYLAAKAIIKYMAFKSTEVDVPVPMTFTAGAETISTLLEESEGHIKGTDYVEKETLRDVYLDLLQAAAIIRAVHWQRIDTKTDTKSQLLGLLKGSVNLAAAIAKPQVSSENGGAEKTFDPEKDFEDFIDSVEDGFRSTTGITDTQNPYGKSPDRRPRIRQIGDNIAQAGGND